MLELEIRGDDVAQALAARMAQAGTQLPRVLALALNRTVTMARTQAGREVATATGLPTKYIRPSFSIRRATVSTQEAALVAQSKRIPLLAFMPKTRFKSGLGAAGLPYRFGAVPAGGFFAQMPPPSLHRGIFRRRTSRRLPIEEVMGPTIPDVILRAGIMTALRTQAVEVLQRRIEHELDRVLSGQAASNA